MTNFLKWTGRVVVLTVMVSLVCPIDAQTKTKQSDTAESLGLGTASRFETGYTPIVIDRTTIVPGVPFNVKPTMDNLVKTSGPSMGGILNRFDTSKFGQFFNASTLSIPNVSITKSIPASAVSPAGATSQLKASPSLYPPQLVLDYNETKQTDVSDPLVKEKINLHLQQILDRYPLASPEEQVILVFDGRKLILRGKIESAYTSDLLFIAMQMEPGIDAVVNELEIIKP